jgi:hypothetical protein
MKRAPQPPRGTVEQAIFTWSLHKLGGGQGAGIADTSPGLRNHLPWLNSLDLNGLRPFDPTLCDEGHGYDGWRRLEANGALPVGDLTVVYRKIASAGDDGAGRNRFVVHLLVGRGDELHLGALTEDDPHWLRAEQCRLGDLPKLHTLSVADLRTYRAEHQCSTVDADAQALLVDFLCDPTRVKQIEPADIPALTTRLLVAFPAALWSQLRLGFWIGTHGPIARVGIGDSSSTGPPNLNVAGLDQCPFHARVEEYWARLSPDQTTFEAFAESFASTVMPAQPVPPVRIAAAKLDGIAKQDRIRAIRVAISDPAWDGRRALNNLQAMRALAALERMAAPTGGWLGLLDDDEIAAIFGGLESGPGFSRAVLFFRNTATPMRDIAAGWRRTSLAAMAVGALSIAPSGGPEGSIGIPARLDANELQKLVRHLRRHEDGIEQLADLVRELAWSSQGRAGIVEALRGAGAGPAEIFGVVLTRAKLSPELQLEFIREDVESAVAWLEVPEDYREALRLILTERPRFSFQVLRHSVRVFDA